MFGRILPVCSLVAVLFGLSASAAEGQKQQAQIGPPQVGPPQAALARRPLDAELLQRTEIQYLDTQLGDVVVDLELRHRIEIFLDTKALLAVGKGPETTFSKQIKGVPFGAALGHLLDDEGLVWFVADEMLHITTPAAARAIERTTVYSVARLADEGKEPDYEAISGVIESSVFHTKRFHVNRTIRPHHPTKTLVIATNPLEHREIAKLVGELVEAKQYAGDEKTLPEPSETDAAITRVLTAPNEVQYLDTALEDVRTDLELRTRVFIEIDRPAIAEAANQRGKGPETVISYSAQDVPLAVMLDQMLEPLGLTWTRDDVAIVITSKAAETEYAVRRMYRVGDLADGPGDVNDLVDLVRQTVAADTWVDEPGADAPGPVRLPIGVIASYPPAGVLVVTQTPRTQRAIATLLEDLRAAKKAP